MLISAAHLLFDDLMALFDLFKQTDMNVYNQRTLVHTVLRTTYVDCVPPYTQAPEHFLLRVVNCSGAQYELLQANSAICLIQH